MPHAQGVRRRREESNALEIEELDSCTMRQNSYNYFQHHRVGSRPPRTSTFCSSLRCGPASIKRQRTLAEQLDDLCLQGTNSQAADGFQGRSRRELRPAKAKTVGAARFIELDDINQEEGLDIDNSSSVGDGMGDVVGKLRGLQVYGDAAIGRELSTVFAKGAGKRHRAMDRVYRHYVAVAANSTSTDTNTSQGDSIVVFRPSVAVKTPLVQELPAYISLKPNEFENLSMADKRQWYHAHKQYMREMKPTAARNNEGQTESQMEAKLIEPGVMLSRDQSFGSKTRWLCLDKDAGDVEMIEESSNHTAPKLPHAAGALTHTKWFTDDA